MVQLGSSVAHFRVQIGLNQGLQDNSCHAIQPVTPLQIPVACPDFVIRLTIMLLPAPIALAALESYAYVCY